MSRIHFPYFDAEWGSMAILQSLTDFLIMDTFGVGQTHARKYVMDLLGNNNASMLFTHPHKDHNKDCGYYIRKDKIKTLYISNVPAKQEANSDKTRLNEYVNLIKKHGGKVVYLKTGGGLLRGDVLLNTTHHTAMYVGGGKEVEASINELGKATGGKPGDQTGKEFLIRSYRNYPWTHVLRFKGSSVTSGDFRTPSKTKRYSGIVATKSDPLNVRKGPGTEYGLCQTFGPLKKGTQVDVCDTATAADGSTWLYICYRGAKWGFVSAKYIREV